MNGGGEEEHGGLKKGPSPGQQTLVQQPKAGASTAAEPGKNTLVPPSPATATNSSPGGAKAAASVASPAADKDPSGGSEHAAATSAPTSEKAAADGSKDVATGAPKEPSVASKDAVETASPAQEKDSTDASKDAAPGASNESASADKGSTAGSKETASSAGPVGDKGASPGSKDAASSTSSEKAPAAADAAKAPSDTPGVAKDPAGAQPAAKDASLAGDASPAVDSAPKANNAPPSGPPLAPAPKDGGGHLAAARAGASADGGAPAAAPNAAGGDVHKKAAGAEKAAKAPLPVQPPPPAAKTKVAAAPSRGAQHAAEQIEAVLAAEQQALAAAAGTKRTALQSAADSQAEQILSASGGQYAATISAITDRQQGAKTTFAQARGHIEITRATEVELARSDARAAEKRLRDGSGSLTAKMKEVAESEGARMKQAAQGSVDRCQASAMKLADDITATVINPTAVMSDLNAGEQVAIDHAVADAKSQARGELIFGKIKLQGKLGGTALDNANAFRDDADTIVGKVHEAMPDAFGAIYETADATIGLINHTAAKQMAAIDGAEHQTMSALEHAKSEARSVHDAGHITAAELRSKVVGQITILNNQEAASSKGLAAMADEALAAINTKRHISHLEASHAVEATKKALKTGGHKLLAAVDETAGKAFGLINGATAAYNDGVAGQRDKLLKNVDGAIGQAASVLAQSNNEFDASCKMFRATAVTAYVGSESQMFLATGAQISKAATEWKSQASEFIASCQSYESETVAKHGEVRAAVRAQLESVARKTVAHMRRSRWDKIVDGVKDGLSRFGTGFAIFVGVVILVAVVLVVVFGLAIGAAVALGLAIVGAIMLGIGLIRSVITRLKQLWNNDWPWYAKILGIPAALGVAVGDVLGLSQMAEGIRGRELISEKELTTEERAARFTEGVLQFITLGLMKELSKRGGAAPKGELPPGSRGQLPPGDPTTTTAPGETTTTTTSPKPGETTTTTSPKPGETTTTSPPKPAETTTTVEPPKPPETTATTEPPKSEPPKIEPPKNEPPAQEPPKTEQPAKTEPPGTTPEPPKTTEPPAPEPPKTTEPPAPEPPKPIDPTQVPAPPKPSDVTNAPEQAKSPDPAKVPEPPKPAESPFKAEGAAKSKNYRGTEVKKEFDKYDFKNDPDAKAAIEKAWQDAFNEEYVKQRENGTPEKKADQLAHNKAKKAGRELAEARAGEPLALERARQQARDDHGTGTEFSDNLDSTSKAVKDGYDTGAPQGQTAKMLGPQLEGKTVPEMEAILDADIAANKATKQPRSYLSNGKPMDSWLYNDGTLVRIKPQGSEQVPTPTDPMFAIEVLKQPGVTGGAQDAVAFKVGADGKATPKGPGDLKNPYKPDINKAQHDAYANEALQYGHQQAKVDPPPPP